MLIYMTLDIRTRFNFMAPQGLVGRAYIFPSSREETGEAIKNLGYVLRAEDFREKTGIAKSLDYTNAILWSDSNGDKMIDFFGYTLENKDWDSNPSVFSWVTKNGIIVPEGQVSEVSCEKGIIVMGFEGIHRLSTRSLDEYLANAPGLPCFKFKEMDFAGLI